MTNERYRWHTPFLADLFATKPFLKIGEVAKLLGVKPHVLRYWESEFPSLNPKKNPSGQRIYARTDIETIVEIKNLLYNQRYTISGAKRLLARQEEGEHIVAQDHTEKDFAHEVTHLKQAIHGLLVLLQRVPE